MGTAIAVIVALVAGYVVRHYQNWIITQGKALGKKLKKHWNEHRP